MDDGSQEEGELHEVEVNKSERRRGIDSSE